jgi:hypothetical protein
MQRFAAQCGAFQRCWEAMQNEANVKLGRLRSELRQRSLAASIGAMRRCTDRSPFIHRAEIAVERRQLRRDVTPMCRRGDRTPTPIGALPKCAPKLRRVATEYRTSPDSSSGAGFDTDAIRRADAGQADELFGRRSR